MKRLFILISLTVFCFALCPAQSVTRTQHRAALTQDVVTTGSMTIRKPDYICISTDADKEQLVMDGTKFTMVMGGRKHVTDSRKNPQFATFHEVLKAVINNQPVPQNDELKVTTRGQLREITITPAAKKKRQLFTSFVLTIDSRTSAIRQIRMNERGGNFINYDLK